MASTGEMPLPLAVTTGEQATSAEGAAAAAAVASPPSRRASLSRKRSVSGAGAGAGQAGAVELALIPGVDAAALLAQARRPSEQQIEAHAAAEEQQASNGVVAPPSSGAEHLTTEYLKYLEELQHAWTDCPAVEITFDHLSYSVRNDSTIADAQVARAAAARRAKHGARDEDGAGAAAVAPSPSEENTPNLAKAVVHMATAPFRAMHALGRAAAKIPPAEDEVLLALAPCSGVIRPGSMTLILAPPGAGKSVLLRALSGRLQHDSGLAGELRYNGLTNEECRKRGIFVTRMASYVGQNDLQFPVLTVEETLEFAKANGVADVELLNPSDKLRSMDARRTALLMDLLGLAECKDTPIGSDLMRGVSGGQRKRAQLGETMMSNARIYALDEVSNGLDSAVTLHIFAALKQACAVNRSSVLTALQQVTPETYALFDDVILMRDGHVVYHGPRDGVRTWLRDVMHVPFIPDSLEEAGFLVDLLSDPRQALDKASLAHKVALAQAEGRKPSPAPQPYLALSGSDDEGDEGRRASPSPGAAPSPVPVAVAAMPVTEGGVPLGDHSPAAPSSTDGEVAVVRFHIGNEAEASPNGNGHLAAPLAHRPSSAVDGHHHSSPFKLSHAELASLTDLSQFLAINERSVQTGARRSLVADAMAGKEALALKSMTVSKWSPYSQHQYGQEFPHSTIKHTALACSRQSKLMSRNLTMVVPRIFNSILMGFVYGLLFFQLDTSAFDSRLGIIQNAVMFMAFANFQELPVAAEGKQVVVRQINAGFLPSISYTTAVNLLTLPLAMVEAVVFGIIVYWLPAFEADAGRFFFFLFLLLSVSSAMSQTFRTVTYIAANADVAHQLNMPFVMLFVVYGGFLIPRTSVQNWLIWAYYMSPFSWATDSLAVNEFSAGTYGSINPDGRRLGDSYLDAFGLRAEKVWQWAAVAYLWGFYLVLSGVSSLLLKYSAPTVPLGTKRPNAARVKPASAAAAKALPAGEEAEAVPNVHIEITSAVGASSSAAGPAAPGVVDVKKKGLGANGARSSAGAKESFQLSSKSLPFEPATLSWKDLKYTVYVGKDKTPKVLLNHISGYAEPGKLTALMGSSGAGKTTLLDVIAGRKTVGLIEHESNIFVNGLPKDPATFPKITGYVEQQDIHNGMATVREALTFSAKLRLPASVTDVTREAFVDEVMGLVGLTSVQHRMIGDVSQPSLSTGQLKLLTIAVELVANPSIIFLDEPTSGLDSKSAFRVMKAIKRIANTGRTIVCTIHQPSQEVFFMFDRLLLLRRGGAVVYFDDIGTQGDTLVNYLTDASRNLIPYSPLVSPANWMLDVVGLDATALIEEQKAEEELKAKEAGEAAAKANKASGGSPKDVVAADPGAPGAVVDSSSVAASAGVDSNAVQAAFRRKLLAAAKSSATSRKSAPGGAEEEINAEPIQFSEVWKASPAAARANAVTEQYSTPSGVQQPPSSNAAPVEYVGGFTRLLWVARRAYISHWRSPPVNVTRCILMFVIGLFLGIVYYNVNVQDYAGMSSLLAAVFLGVSLPSSVCSNASLATFFRQRAVYYRESSVGMYGYKTYTACMSLVEAPYLLLGLLCFLLPFYWLVGLQADAGLFFQFLFAAYLMCQFFAAMEQIFIASLPSLIAAQALNGLMMSICFAFGGLYIKASAIPIGWKWFYYIDPIPKSFIATMLTQLWCPEGDRAAISTSTANIDGCRRIELPGSGSVQLYSYVADLLEGAHHSYWPMIGWLVLTIAVARAISVLLFKKVSHIER